MRSASTIAVVVAVTAVILAVAMTLVWWLWSVLVHPLPYNAPEAIPAAATTQRG
jgi:hypothetical protein